MTFTLVVAWILFCDVVIGALRLRAGEYEEFSPQYEAFNAVMNSLMVAWAIYLLMAA